MGVLLLLLLLLLLLYNIFMPSVGAQGRRTRKSIHGKALKKVIVKIPSTTTATAAYPSSQTPFSGYTPPCLSTGGPSYNLLLLLVQ